MYMFNKRFLNIRIIRFTMGYEVLIPFNLYHYQDDIRDCAKSLDENVQIENALSSSQLVAAIKGAEQSKQSYAVITSMSDRKVLSHLKQRKLLSKDIDPIVIQREHDYSYMPEAIPEDYLFHGLAEILKPKELAHSQ